MYFLSVKGHTLRIKFTSLNSMVILLTPPRQLEADLATINPVELPMVLRVLCALGYQPHLSHTLPAKLAATLEDRMSEIAVEYSPAVRVAVILLSTGKTYLTVKSMALFPWLHTRLPARGGKLHLSTACPVAVQQPYPNASFGVCPPAPRLLSASRPGPASSHHASAPLCSPDP